jgi:ketosteroid isomerase-like protein
MSQENVEVVRRGIAAYNRRDLDALRTLNHPEIEVDYSASRGVEAGIYRGQDEVLRLYQQFFELFERIRLEPDRFIDAGDAVVVPNSAQMRGKHGVDTVARSTLVFEVRGGRVTRICLYQETDEALEALGLQD